jgi:2,3-diketo-5-methylthio-1-phosphopentane phosphatase
MRTTWLCDFDGTIARTDVGAALVERYAGGDRARRRALAEAWLAGRLGSRALIVAECAAVRVSRAEALAFVRGFELDPAFAAFAAAAAARGERVEVVSDGFDFYVRELLERAGLGGLPQSANRVRFTGDRMIPSFPKLAPAGACGRCGNCKAAHVARARSGGDRVVLVGDGSSDRCAAPVADQVLAKGPLLLWCRERGIAAHPFDDFADVERIARQRTGALPRAAAAPAGG